MIVVVIVARPVGLAIVPNPFHCRSNSQSEPSWATHHERLFTGQFLKVFFKRRKQIWWINFQGLGACYYHYHYCCCEGVKVA